MMMRIIIGRGNDDDDAKIDYEYIYDDKYLAWQTQSICSSTLTNNLAMADTAAKQKNKALELIRRYSALCGLSSSFCRGLRPLSEAFVALWAKKELFRLLFLFIFGVQ